MDDEELSNPVVLTDQTPYSAKFFEIARWIYASSIGYTYPWPSGS